MEVLILRDGVLFARARADDTDTGVFSVTTVLDTALPEYPAESAGRGKEYELQYADGVLTWAAVDRELTQSEQIETLEEELDGYRYPEYVQPTGAHDCYNVGNKVTYNGQHYASLINGNVWSPAVYPAGWQQAD